MLHAGEAAGCDGTDVGLNLDSISVSCVSLGKLLSHSEPVSSVIKMVLIIILPHEAAVRIK